MNEPHEPIGYMASLDRKVAELERAARTVAARLEVLTIHSAHLHGLIKDARVLADKWRLPPSGSAVSGPPWPDVTTRQTCAFELDAIVAQMLARLIGDLERMDPDAEQTGER